MTSGRNRVTEAIEAWRALGKEEQDELIDDIEEMVCADPFDSREVVVNLLRAAAEPEAKAQSEECWASYGGTHVWLKCTGRDQCATCGEIRVR